MRGPVQLGHDGVKTVGLRCGHDVIGAVMIGRAAGMRDDAVGLAKGAMVRLGRCQESGEQQILQHRPKLPNKV